VKILLHNDLPMILADGLAPILRASFDTGFSPNSETVG
jgi:hypothetical protein